LGQVESVGVTDDVLEDGRGASVIRQRMELSGRRLQEGAALGWPSRDLPITAAGALQNASRSSTIALPDQLVVLDTASRPLAASGRAPCWRKGWLTGVPAGRGGARGRGAGRVRSRWRTSRPLAPSGSPLSSPSCLACVAVAVSGRVARSARRCSDRRPASPEIVRGRRTPASRPSTRWPWAGRSAPTREPRNRAQRA
jgi:hypothetical protein